MRKLIVSISLLLTIVFIVSGIYPLLIWSIGQTVFPLQANGSLVQDRTGKIVGSSLIAQDFQQDLHFHPRPSAAKYDAANSKSSALAPSNYLLRNRVARFIGTIARDYDGKLIGADIEAWFARDNYNGKPGIVSQWAKAYPTVAKDWINADADRITYLEQWAKVHPELLLQYTSDTQVFVPTVDDLCGIFFEDFAKHNPGKFPNIIKTQDAAGKIEIRMEAIATGPEIQATFFDMWRQEHPDIRLKFVQGDMVTTSGSGLDPHITLKNAMQQLDRVSAAWTRKVQQKKSDTATEENVRQIIKAMLQKKSFAPMAGLAGEELINVLEINRELHKRFDVGA